ncbi:hypothetical protein CALCODRAFT_533175 [Calocera cornea HHB12733]|uniref:Uncharacterized protein n=1 Tax=Calocera cornea HHB12733 TaxID=1353952 RepID=A0A165IAG8_9BASI|nr:hypothetical protein CALCODRAFT_533175 [Calocera cornea HHB12733]
MLRDNFQLSTWVLLGAALVGTSFFIVGPSAFYGVLGVYALIAWRLVETLVMTIGWVPNKWLKNVIPGELVTSLLVRSALMPAIIREVHSPVAPTGFLGMSTFLGTEREANNLIITLMYFRTTEGLHKFALSQVHRDTWNWWLDIQKKYPHLSIMHETYDVPPRHWEAIYVHSHKAGLSGASMKMEEKDEEGRDLWWSTPINAARGRFRSSKGRMGWSEGDDNEKVGFMEYH